VSESISPEVQEALRKAIQQDGEVRLVGRGAKAPGLFPGGKAKGKARDAQAQCLDPRLNLFKVVRTAQEDTAPGAQPTQYVIVDDPGIALLFESLPAEQHRDLLDMVATRYKDRAITASLAATKKKLDELNRQRARLVEQEAKLDDFLRHLAEDRLKVLRAERERIDKELARLDVSPKPEEVPVAPIKAKPGRDEDLPWKVRDAKSEEELDCQRDLAENLVYTWQDAESAETREALERVMINVGLEPVGEQDEVVPFDGNLHYTQNNISPGDKVVVRLPGWRLVNRRGRYLIARARVEQVAATNEVTHAVAHD
jgi:hypothetical protein